MIIIGVDYHPEFQQIAWVDTETGELKEARLHHPKVRSDPRERRTFPLRQAGRELSGSGAFRGIQRKPQAVGSHHEAGQFDVALSAGGSGAGHGA